MTQEELVGSTLMPWTVLLKKLNQIKSVYRKI